MREFEGVLYERRAQKTWEEDGSFILQRIPGMFAWENSSQYKWDIFSQSNRRFETAQEVNKIHDIENRKRIHKEHLISAQAFQIRDASFENRARIKRFTHSTLILTILFHLNP